MFDLKSFNVKYSLSKFLATLKETTYLQQLGANYGNCLIMYIMYF